jgi:mono/diheme cytochrome c family protein
MSALGQTFRFSQRRENDEQGRAMKYFLSGFVCALFVAAFAAVTWIYSGWHNVAALEPHGQLVSWVFNTTMQRSVRLHAAGIAAPANLTARASSGFGDFDEMCVECHSAPGMERGEAGKGLNPRPPRLVNAARRWSPSELFWIVKNGIRMTGMPAFGPTHDDDTLWAIVAFVQQLSSLSPEQYKSMRLTNDAAPKAHDHSGEENHSDSHR